jgi:hypothetical protein
MAQRWTELALTIIRSETMEPSTGWAAEISTFCILSSKACTRSSSTWFIQSINNQIQFFLLQRNQEIPTLQKSLKMEDLKITTTLKAYHWIYFCLTAQFSKANILWLSIESLKLSTFNTLSKKLESHCKSSCIWAQLWLTSRHLRKRV